MAKNSIRDYDNTSGNNTDIQSVDISEGCSPAGINNALREILADLADVNDGTVALTSPSADSMTVTGDLTVDTNTLHVDSTNNRVGIGTVSPDARMSIEQSGTGDFNSIILSRTTGNVGDAQSVVWQQNDLSNLKAASISGEVTGASAGALNFNTASGGTLSERMRIDSSGNVMVGRTSGSSTTNDAGLVFSDFGYIYSARDGTSAQTHHLFVNNAAVSATAVGSIRTSGSSTSYNTTSDYRLKENVADLTGAIIRIKNLSPKRFNFTGFTDTVDGFLAHEAQTVVPEAVHGTHNETEAIGDIADADNNPVETGVVEPDTLEDGHTWTATGTQPVYQGIDQAKLVPLLTAALQEAIAKIETLETQNADFETRLTALEAE